MGMAEAILGDVVARCGSPKVVCTPLVEHRMVMSPPALMPITIAPIAIRLKNPKGSFPTNKDQEWVCIRKGRCKSASSHTQWRLFCMYWQSEHSPNNQSPKSRCDRFGLAPFHHECALETVSAAATVSGRSAQLPWISGDEEAPTAERSGLFPGERCLSHLVPPCDGMAGSVTLVPASLWQFNHSDRRGVHPPMVESTLITHHGSETGAPPAARTHRGRG